MVFYFYVLKHISKIKKITFFISSWLVISLFNYIYKDYNYNIMSTFLQLLMTIIPAVLVLIATYFILNRLLKREQEEKWLKIQRKRGEKWEQAQLSAAERMVLFCERIYPDHLLTRLNPGGKKAKFFHLELLLAIQQEFDHNVTQQIYLSDALWKIINLAKQEIIEIISIAFEKVDKDADAIHLAHTIQGLYGQLEKSAIPVAINAIKKEMKGLFESK
jgi:hypothetical protein